MTLQVKHAQRILNDDLSSGSYSYLKAIYKRIQSDQMSELGFINLFLKAPEIIFVAAVSSAVDYGKPEDMIRKTRSNVARLALTDLMTEAVELPYPTKFHVIQEV